MTLLTVDILKKLQKTPLYTHEKTDKTKIPVIVKFFHPFSSWTWYVTEGKEEENGDWLFFGLVDGFEKELGYFRLSELRTVRKLGLGIERDMHFGKHYLAEFMNQTRN